MTREAEGEKRELKSDGKKGDRVVTLRWQGGTVRIADSR